MWVKFPSRLPHDMPVQMRREAYLLALEAGIEPPQGALDREITPAKSGRGEGAYRLYSFGSRYET